MKTQSESVGLYAVKLPTSCPLLTPFQFENALRRHNHMGLMHALLKLLAKTNKLDAAREGAKTKMTERRERAKARAEDMDED